MDVQTLGFQTAAYWLLSDHGRSHPNDRIVVVVVVVVLCGVYFLHVVVVYVFFVLVSLADLCLARTGFGPLLYTGLSRLCRRLALDKSQYSRDMEQFPFGVVVGGSALLLFWKQQDQQEAATTTRSVSTTMGCWNGNRGCPIALSRLVSLLFILVLVIGLGLPAVPGTHTMGRQQQRGSRSTTVYDRRLAWKRRVCRIPHHQH